MALILWSDDFSVGVDRLDSDHITIFSLINHIDEASQSGSDEKAIGHILRTLTDVALAHFNREESLMKLNGYPEFEAHAAEHMAIVDELTSLSAAYHETPSAEICRELVEMLSAWLEGHILESDMRYRPYIGKPTDG